MLPLSATFRLLGLSLVVLLFVGCFSCNNKPRLKRQFVLADSLMLIRPDSALKILEGMTENDLNSEEEKIDYYLLLVEAKDKNYIKHKSDSLINYVYNAYKNREDNAMKAKVLFFKGRVYHDMEKFEDAALYYKKAETVAKKTKSYRLLGLVYNELGGVSMWLSMYDKAFDHYVDSYNMMLMVNDTATTPYAIRNLGRMRLFQHRYDESLTYYQRAFDMAQMYKKPRIQSDVLYEIALLYDQIQKKDSVLYYMRKSITYNPDIVSTDETSLAIADIYRKAGKTDSALVYIDKCIRSENIFSKTSAYRYLSEISESQHNPTKALEYYKVYSTLKDSILTRSSAEDLTEIIAKYDNERLQNEKTEILLEKTRTMRNLYLVLLISVLLGAATLTAFYIYRKKKEHQLKVLRAKTSVYLQQIEANQIQIKENEKWVAEKEKLIRDTNLKLEEKEVQLYKLKQKEDETSRLKRENQKLERIREELNREIDLLAKRKEKITVINAGIESQYSLIDRLRSWKPGDSIMSETEQNQLPDLMDKECNDFATKLRIRYPALKSHDILICCLIKLRISNEYIASLTCCKYESVLTKRFRIKQRMNEKEENLESIINHIS